MVLLCMLLFPYLSNVVMTVPASWSCYKVLNKKTHHMLNGLPSWLSGKESVCNAGDLASIPWVRKIPWRRAWQPTPVFLPWESPWTEEPSSLQSMGSQSQTWLKPLGSNSAQQTLTVFISSQLWFPPPGSLDSNLFCTWVADFYWLNFGHTVALSKKIAAIPYNAPN